MSPNSSPPNLPVPQHSFRACAKSTLLADCCGAGASDAVYGNHVTRSGGLSRCAQGGAGKNALPPCPLHTCLLRLCLTSLGLQTAALGELRNAEFCLIPTGRQDNQGFVAETPNAWQTTSQTS